MTIFVVVLCFTYLLFPTLQEVDVSLEWLSVFVEDCLTSTGNCLPAPAAPSHVQTINRTSSPKTQKSSPTFEKFAIPAKARSKRRRVTGFKTRTNPLTSWTYGHRHHIFHQDPPLLQQTHWLADSELIMPKVGENEAEQRQRVEEQVEEEENYRSKVHFGGMENGNGGGQGQQGVGRRCSHCQSQRTPQWRAGPLGPKTLCNACGVRYKSGRLLPEYRPAKSPTFVSYLHSNSHKKVLEMRMTSPDE